MKRTVGEARIAVVLLGAAGDGLWTYQRHPSGRFTLGCSEGDSFDSDRREWYVDR